MGLFDKVAKSGIAKKVAAEASKPENQAKIKDLASKIGKNKPGPTATR